MGIVAVGGANVDWMCRSNAAIRPGTSNPGAVARSFGGVARNVACNLAKLRVPVRLLAAVGSDLVGDDLVRDCRGLGVDCSLTARLDGSTGQYVATLDADGELVVAIAAAGVTENLRPEIVRGHEAALADADMIFADANLQSETLLVVAEIAARNGVPLVLDPVSTPKAHRVRDILQAGWPVALATPNRDELAVLAERPAGTPVELESAAAVLRSDGIAALIVGLGGSGAFVAGPGTQAFVRSRAAGVVDVTGAGDAAIAAAMWALLRGGDLIAAAQAGQIAAAVTVAGHGAVSDGLTTDVLERALAETGAGHGKGSE